MSKLKLNRRETISLAGAALTAQTIFAPLPKALAVELDMMIFFAFDTAELTPTQKKIAEAIKRRIKPRAKVTFTGHCDGAESEPDALGLSRAVAVLQVLAATGLPAGVQLTAVSAGKTKPLVRPPANGKEPQNRRVDVTIE
jgi:outer membrane protein OmpA-like peptidoglycan-associated protein